MREEEDEPSTSGEALNHSENGISQSLEEKSSEKSPVVDPWDLAVAREYEIQKRQHKIGLIVNGRYEIDNKIGFGTFGSIFAATSKDTGERVAVKFEYESTTVNDKSHLFYEEEIYRNLSGIPGFPKIHWVGRQHGYNLLIMDLLGPNLEQLLSFCGKRFTLGTILSVGEKMLALLRTFHELGFIHRDIKPANFLVGIGPDEDKLFLVDFGLAKLFKEGEKHIDFSNDHHMVGTARYASLNAHFGRELSRRDDLEAAGFVLISFFNGALPWSEVGGRTKKQRYNKIKRAKGYHHPDRLCQGLPKEFADYLRYCRNLKFEETPDYDYLLNLFQSCRRRMKIPSVSDFDWNDLVRRNWQKKESWSVLYKWTLPKEEEQKEVTPKFRASGPTGFGSNRVFPTHGRAF